MLGTGPDVIAVVAAPTGEGAVDVELHFHGLSELHRNFFSSPDAVGPLGRALAPCLTQPAQVVIAYDTETRVGRLTLRVPPGGSTCAPAFTDAGLDLSPMVPLGTALAAYRDKVAATTDFRLSSFELAIQHTRGTSTCVLRARGDHPTSGKLWARCIGTSPDERCAPGEDGVVTLALGDDDLAHARRCYAD